MVILQSLTIWLETKEMAIRIRYNHSIAPEAITDYLDSYRLESIIQSDMAPKDTRVVLIWNGEIYCEFPGQGKSPRTAIDDASLEYGEQFVRELMGDVISVLVFNIPPNKEKMWN